MQTMGTLPKAKISGIYSLESRATRLAESCDYLELPLKYTDRLLVVDTKDGRLHRQCTVGMFTKSGGKPYCVLQQKVYNFYVLVRRGDIDYKITARDFRLELLRVKGVLK